MDYIPPYGTNWTGWWIFTKSSPQVQERAYLLSKCMTCGYCMEACPNVNANSKFVVLEASHRLNWSIPTLLERCKKRLGWNPLWVKEALANVGTPRIVPRLVLRELL